MADQICHNVRSPELRPKLISGRFFPNGTSTSPLPFVGEGIASVVRTASAGVFTVTLLDSYAQLISATADVQHVTAADLEPQYGAFANLGTSEPVSFTLRVLAGSTGTDITANADSSVMFQVLFNDSGVT
jgi:hypothetical protein